MGEDRLNTENWFMKIKTYLHLEGKKIIRIFFCFLGIICFLIFSFDFNLEYINSFEFSFRISKFFCLFLFTLFFLSKTFCIDAGSLPYKRKFTPSIDEKECVNNIHLKEIKLNNYAIQVKFCRTCMIWRPPRTSHCSLCGSCKLKFDHHCPWIGKCVALKNYRHFIFFIIYLFWFLISKWEFFFKDSTNEKIFAHFINRFTSIKVLDTFFRHQLFEHKIKQKFSREILFLLKTPLKLIGFFASIFTGALIIFHFYLGYTGKTTSEFLKFPNKNIKSWSFRKEMINKFYKKRYSTIIKIRLTEIRKFSLVKMNLNTECNGKTKISLNITLIDRLKRFLEHSMRFFFGFYLLMGIWYKKDFETSIFYNLSDVFFSLINFFGNLFILISKIVKTKLLVFF